MVDNLRRIEDLEMNIRTEMKTIKECLERIADYSEQLTKAADQARGRLALG